MVAVKSAHFNLVGTFAVDYDLVVARIGRIINQQSSDRLAETWCYCQQQCKKHQD